jgi:superfamily I DNA/RNA helicase
MENIEEISSKLGKISGGIRIVGTHRRDRPDLIFFRKGSGFYAIEIQDAEESLIDCGKRLAEKCRQLRIAFPELAKSHLEQVVVSHENVDSHTIGAATRVLAAQRIEKLVSDFAGKEENLNDDEIQSVLLRLQPAMTFQGVVRVPSEDEGARDRALMRLALDETQAEFASVDAEDVLKIIGPPGSGKTLVLIARAKLFATNNPKWKIQFVAYNKSLAGYLENQFFDFDNIHVTTFSRFAADRGHKASRKDDEDKYFNQMSKNVKKDIDALFIDEYQDFQESWMTYCMATVKDGRGGISVAGDSKQALYRFQPPDKAFAKRKVRTVSLTRPYRSTRQILEVASRVDSEFKTEGISEAPEGQEVKLVFGGSWNDQADYISWEISRMISEDSRRPGDIAILGAVWNAVKRLESRLDELGVKYAVVGGRDDLVHAPEWGKITLTTVHSAKGYEFDVVFLMAVEALPNKNQDPEDTKKRRSAYVGPTRARDELFITYTKRNDIIDKLHDAPTSLISPWTWPDDFKKD